MIEFELDGEKLEVAEGTNIIQAADEAGVKIPRFCYHKKLSIAANCRMCLVHVEKAPKPLPACATPITSGMVVHTKSPEAIAAQQSVMEFLLINHPLDCPICDQGGECELQDVAMGYGKGVSRYTEGKRSVDDENLGSLIATDMTRCIHCTRCVRFGEEIAGVKELGVTSRGETSRIGTYIEKQLVSELSGNVIDLCPVGALTSKPFRYRARSWELQQSLGVAAHDCVGSNIHVHSLRNNVMRVVPRDNEELNESWISDRDRFAYTGLNAEDRLAAPLIKRDGKWQEADWRTALFFIAEKLKSVVEQNTAQQVGALLSPNSSIEEAYLLQKLMRALGSHNIDHRIRQTDFNDQDKAEAQPGLNISLNELSEQDAFLLIGSDLRCEQPILNHRLRQASKKNKVVMSINPMDYEFNFQHDAKIIVAAEKMLQVLSGVAKAVLPESLPKEFAKAAELLAGVTPTQAEANIAKQLQQTEKSTLLLGALALNHPNASVLRSLAELIASVTKSSIGYLTEGANGAGAWLAGAVPHRGPAAISVAKPGLTAKQQWQSQLKAYFLLGIEPEVDCENPSAALSALKQAELVVAISPYKGKAEEYADVILPMAAFGETSGTFVNITSTWQSFKGCVKPYEQARPAWKILRVLGNLLNLDGFNYEASSEILDEVKQKIDSMSGKQIATWSCPEKLPTANNDLNRISSWPMYRVDSTVRRAEPLQASAAHEKLAVYVNEKLASSLNLDTTAKVSQNSGAIELPVVIDNRVPEQCVYIPAGYPEVATLGESFGSVKVERS